MLYTGLEPMASDSSIPNLPFQNTRHHTHAAVDLGGDGGAVCVYVYVELS